MLLEELATYKATADEYAVNQEETRRAHSDVVAEKDSLIESLEDDARTSSILRTQYEAELNNLRRELQASQAERDKLLSSTSQHSQLTAELEKQRTLLNDTQSELKKTKEHRDALQTSFRDLQAQISRPQQPEFNNTSRRGNMSKLPPLTPPPSVPPPPAPKSIPPVPVPVPVPSAIPMEASNSMSSQSNTLRSSGSSRDSNPDSPATSVAPDPKLLSQIEEQTKHMEEQEVMIKTLNKQLSHCESDLQAHMDLVSTLETSLGDSEKNRKLFPSLIVCFCVLRYFIV